MTSPSADPEDWADEADAYAEDDHGAYAVSGRARRVWVALAALALLVATALTAYQLGSSTVRADGCRFESAAEFVDDAAGDIARPIGGAAEPIRCADDESVELRISFDEKEIRVDKGLDHRAPTRNIRR